MAALMPSTPPGRPGHRRSYVASGPGAFASLGALPRRRQQQQQQKKFSLTGNDDEEDSPDDDVLHNIPPALRLNPNNSFRLTISTDDDALSLRNIPFPRSSAPASPTEQPPSRPSMTRTTSTPVLLSNGKPLKSSLKSSTSSPHIPFPPQHLRARSAPSTPHLEQLPSPVPKNVHFPTNEEGGLATVRIYNRSAKPASLLTRPNGEDTETETEGELSTGSSGIIRGFSAVSQPLSRSPLGRHHHHQRYEIDSEVSSSVPMKSPPPHANVYFESLFYTPRSSASAPQGLSGTLLVRNIAYEKLVAVRFTLDDWQTTSEVSARHLTSLHTLPPVFVSSSQPLTYGDLISSDAAIPQWDRFAFTIKLEDYAANLSKRTMFLVARYTANATTGSKESWDNNMGHNYKVVFKEAPAPSSTPIPAPVQQRARGFTVSSPPSFRPVMTPTTAVAANSTSSFREPQHAQMVAQTTLLRLKKLNLRNYAAPSNPNSSTTNPSPTSSVNAPAPASSSPPTSSRLVVETSSTPTPGSSALSVGAKEAIGAQDAQGRKRMEDLPAHVGHSSSASSAVEMVHDDTSSDEESLKTPTALGADADDFQEFQFPTSTPPTTTKARITCDPIPILTFSSSSSPSSSASSSSSPELNGLTPINIAHRRNDRLDVLSPLPLEMGTSPPFSTLPEYAASKRTTNGHGHSSAAAPRTGATEEHDSNGTAAVYFPWGLSAGTQTPKSPQEVKKMLEGIREKSTSSPVRRSPTSSGRTSPVKRGVSPPMVNVTNEDGEVVSPQPRKDWSKVGSGWNSSRAPVGTSSPRASPILVSTSSTPAAALSSSTPTPTMANANTNTGSGSSKSDSIYQAVVRQWCFAQGPSPAASLGPASTAHSQLHSTQGQQARYKSERGGGGGGDGAGAGLVV